MPPGGRVVDILADLGDEAPRQIRIYPADHRPGNDRPGLELKLPAGFAGVRRQPVPPVGPDEKRLLIPIGGRIISGTRSSPVVALRPAGRLLGGLRPPVDRIPLPPNQYLGTESLLVPLELPPSNLLLLPPPSLRLPVHRRRPDHGQGLIPRRFAWSLGQRGRLQGQPLAVNGRAQGLPFALQQLGTRLVPAAPLVAGGQAE